MDIVVPPSDDEREDGEIVDEFEDISDSSIPSCGKSDYSQDILRAISLSSISDNSEGAEVSLRKRRRKRRSDHARRKKKRKHDELLRLSRKRRSLSTSSSSSNSDEERLNKCMLRQLQEAVRKNQSIELHHNSLRSRLRAMIEPDSQEDEDVESLRALALLTKFDNSPKPDKADMDDNEVRDMEVDDDKDPPGVIEKGDDTLNDKELAELRSEALKSAVIKKHIERKKRKELDQKENNNELQQDALNSNDKENKDENEEDVDVMRAMLLASISKRITSAPKNTACKPAITSTPNPVARTALQNKQTNAKPPPIKFPSVKPLIIQLNSDSDSDLDRTSGGNSVQEASNPLDETVSKLLRMHREKFESKEKEIEKNDVAKHDNLLDKSVVKLLSKSQQREYQLLKQKLLLANKKKVRKASNRARGLNNDDEKPPQSNLKETLQEMQFQKDGRLQMKGKYKELAPLIQRVNVASERKKRCEETVKVLLAKLKEARLEHSTSHQGYIAVVKQLKQAKENIDLRLTKLATANAVVKHPSTVNTGVPTVDRPNLPTENSTEQTANLPLNSHSGAADPPKKTSLDSQMMILRNSAIQAKKQTPGAIGVKQVTPSKVQKMTMKTAQIKNAAVAGKKVINNAQQLQELHKKVTVTEIQKKTIQADKKKTILANTQKLVQTNKPTNPSNKVGQIHATPSDKANNCSAQIPSNIAPKKTIPVLANKKTLPVSATRQKFNEKVGVDNKIGVNLSNSTTNDLKKVTKSDCCDNVDKINCTKIENCRESLNAAKVQTGDLNKPLSIQRIANTNQTKTNPVNVLQTVNTIENVVNVVPADVTNSNTSDKKVVQNINNAMQDKSAPTDVPEINRVSVDDIIIVEDDDDKIPESAESPASECVKSSDGNRAAFSEYISPLDRRNQIASSNPQQMLCPYELFGTCRDQDCVFNHCP